MKNILLLLLFCSIMNSNFAQGNSDRAKAYYYSAQESFQNKNYEQAIEYCNRAKEILGNSNARIEAINLKSYYFLKQYSNAKRSLDKFLSMDADESLKNEIFPFIVKIEEAERGKQEEKRQERQERIEEEQRYYYYAKDGDISDVTYYLKKYPNIYPEHYKEISLKKNNLEEKIYQNAMNKMDIRNVELYFRYFNDGKYIHEIQEREEIIIEYNTYNRVISSQNIDDYVSFINTYPHSKYMKEVKNAFEDILYQKGNSMFFKNDYLQAKYYYNLYQNYFPKGKYLTTIQQQFIEINKKIEKQNKINNRRNVNYVLASFQTDRSWGIEFGNLNLRYANSYVSFEGRHLFKAFSNNNYLVSLEDMHERYFRKNSATLSAGITKMLAYPIWIYFGGGLRISNYTALNGNPFFKKDEQFSVDEMPTFQVFPELGGYIRFTDYFNIKIGLRYLYKEKYLRTGIGEVKGAFIFKFGLGFCY